MVERKPCYSDCMARPKKIKADGLSEDTLALIDQIKAATGEITLQDGSKQAWNPIVQLAIFAKAGSDADDGSMKKLRIEAAKEVAKYMHAPLKSIEIAGAGGGPIEISIRRFSKKLGETLDDQG